MRHRHRQLGIAALTAVLLCGAGCKPVIRLALGTDVVAAGELDQEKSRPVFIDLRDAESFEAGHVAGAVRVSYQDLNRFLAAQPYSQKRTLVLSCKRGNLVNLAAPIAEVHGYQRVRVLDGGPEEWRRLGLPIATGAAATPASLPTLAGDAESGADDEPAALRHPRVELSLGQQIVAFASGGIIKPLYMILTFILIRRLWGARTTALRLLFHGMTWFFVGEVFCVLNFGLHGSGLVYSLDLAHGAGMVAMSALVPWGLYRLFDDKVLAFAEPERRCAMQRVCGHCWKKEAVVCPAQRVLIFGAICCLALAAMPLSSALRPAQILTTVLGHETEYGVPIFNHIVELRLYPVVAVLLFAVTLVFLLKGGPESVRRAEPVFFIGFGFLFYPLLRHLLLNTYFGAPYWADFWEEATELMLVAGVGWVLYVLRNQLELKPRA